MQQLRKGTLASALFASTAIVSAHAADVTTARLLNSDSEPQNWLQVNGDYSSHRFSLLKDIDKDNVKDLRVVFTTALGGLPGGGANPTGGLEASPVVADGAMYMPDAWGAVYKVDLSDPSRGRIAWIMDPGIPKANVLTAAMRGVTLYKNMVVSGTATAKVNWTKADTGELIKSVAVGDPKLGDTISAAPLLINDELIVPGSGGDWAARAHIDAINADTGAPIWRMYTVPKPGEPGSETWKATSTNAWKTGGGSYWQTGSYDPDEGVTIWGTGNPVPMFDPQYRPGDDLFTNSSIAYDVKTGARKWYFQYTPGDFLDFDEIGSQILVDTTINGEPRKTLVHFGRNGFFYTLDRTNGSFINGGQYVNKLDWTAGLDPKTGKPVEYDPTKDLQTYKIGSSEGRLKQGGIDACPNIQGGVNYFPTTYSPQTGLAYGAGIEGCQTVTAQAPKAAPVPTQIFLAGDMVNNDRQTGSITAMDPTTGKRVAQQMFDYPSYSGSTSTAGGLVFTTTADGTVYAVDDKTLAPLWSFDTGAMSSAPPIVYGNGGKEYVAVLIGATNVVQGLLSKSPEQANLQTTSMLYVFGL